MSLSPFQALRVRLRALLRRPALPPVEAPPPAVDRAALEQLMGTRVDDVELFEQALKHRSRLRGQVDSHLNSNERLEFLGDAVLGLVVAEHLYRQFPDKNEGFLTRLRAKLVNGKALAAYALTVDLGELILMSDNMAQSDGRNNETILADAFEAIIGALYLDRGMEPARRFIHRTMLDHVDLLGLARQHDNYKSLLLEYVQAKNQPQPRYRIVTEEGPSHNKVFTVEVVLNEEAYGEGRARNKKRAEQRAAREALHRLEAEALDTTEV